MGASQIDAYGNQNISLIGADWRRPTRQLIGVRGAPGNTVSHRTDYWVARHTTRVFVPRVDLVSGVGNDRAAGFPGSSMRFHHLGLVVTNLAVLDYDEAGRLRVRSLHPGVTAEEVAHSTGFPIDVSGATETRVPTAEELELIRTVIDPTGLRDREVRA
jgi:acyl CoA:acetate/3-ketoacid CoA transferase beta subunit